MSTRKINRIVKNRVKNTVFLHTNITKKSDDIVFCKEYTFKGDPSTLFFRKKKKLFKKTYLFCSKNEKLLRIYNNRQKIGIILPILTKNDYIIENTYYCLIYIGLYFFIMIFIPIITYIA